MKTSMLLKSTMLAMLVSAPAFAADSMISAKDPEAILEIAQEFGSADLSEDSYGDPLIEGIMNDTDYRVIFYNCDNGKNCRSISFNAYWISRGQVSLRDINEWNSSELLGQAYLDSDRDPNIDFHVNLEHGVSARNLEESFALWEEAMLRFESNMLGY